MDDIAFIDDEIHNTFKATEIKGGDVFLNITGASIGRSAVADDRVIRGNVNQHVCIIRTIKQKLNPKFLNAFLLTENGQKQIDSLQAGGNRQGLNFGQIKSFQIPLPPTEKEQQAIAEVLSDVDALITSLDRLIAKKRNLKQGAMQLLLTGKKRLAGFSGEWEMKKLGEVAEIYQPLTISQNDFSSDGYVVYGANGIVGYYHKYNHETWQTTITCRGSTCGTVNKTTNKSWITGNAMVINLDSNKMHDKLFFYYLLSSQNFTDCITGSGQPQIVRTPLFEFRLKVPPTIEEQKAIARILSDMDAEIKALEKKREKYKAIKQGMMQVLLTGKTRLVKPGTKGEKSD